MKKKRVDIGDILIIFGALIIILWALLKSLGMIHSPIWVEMVSYFGAGVSIIGGAYKLGKIKRGIEQTDEKIDKLLKIEDRFKKVESEHDLCMSGKMKIKH